MGHVRPLMVQFQCLHSKRLTSGAARRSKLILAELRRSAGDLHRSNEITSQLRQSCVYALVGAITRSPFGSVTRLPIPGAKNLHICRLLIVIGFVMSHGAQTARAA